jgi:hypothetical protein
MLHLAATGAGHDYPDSARKDQWRVDRSSERPVRQANANGSGVLSGVKPGDNLK